MTLSYDDFTAKEFSLQEKVKEIHKMINSLEVAAVELDQEASVLIEELHQLQDGYYGSEGTDA